MLRSAVSSARNTLETARTSAAAAALKRAQKETEKLQGKLDEMEKSRAKTGKVTREGTITKITPTNEVKDGKLVLMVLTVRDVDLKDIPDKDLHVEVGGVSLDVTGKANAKGLNDPDNTWEIRFTPPAAKPKEDDKYAPRLLYKEETLATAPSERIIYK